MTNKHKGSDFDGFLETAGILAEAEAIAVKRVLSHQFESAMKKRRLTKLSMAKRMKTSRTALDRLLDPKNSSVTLQTMERAAVVLGKKLKISLI
jgi:DNA-binding Xre family transcriptional regulator